MGSFNPTKSGAWFKRNIFFILFFCNPSFNPTKSGAWFKRMFFAHILNEKLQVSILPKAGHGLKESTNSTVSCWRCGFNPTKSGAWFKSNNIIDCYYSHQLFQSYQNRSMV